MTRSGWLIVPAALVVVAAFAGVRFWRVQPPPKPSAAILPASARELLPPFRKEDVELTVDAHQERNYRVGMQAGSTLVYAWTTGHRGEVLSCDCPGHETSSAAGGHAAFEARSSGWYRWRWKNESDHPIAIQLKLNGYYEAATLPYDK